MSGASVQTKTSGDGLEALSVAHYPEPKERVPPELLSDVVAARRWLEEHDPHTIHLARLDRESVDSAADVRNLVKRWAMPVRRHELHAEYERADECAWASSCRELEKRIGRDHPDFSFPVPYDPSWMERMNCEIYALNLMRREFPHRFAGPHEMKHPFALLRAQGYEPTLEPRTRDLVVYFERPTKYEVRTIHFGTWSNGRVVSKNGRGNVAIHHPDLGAVRGAWRIVFTKPFDAASPVPDMCGYTDWVQLGEVVCRMNVPAWKILVNRSLPKLIGPP